MRAQVVIPEDQIPNWIRSARRGVDWGLVFVVLLALIIGSTYLVEPGIPVQNDSIHTAFRAQDTARALAEGTLYPRWSPHAVYGYGAPILNFTPPLSAYVPAVFTLLLTADVTNSLHLTMILALVAAGAATYSFVLQHHGAHAAFISATLYLFSPPVAYLLPHQEGNIAAVIGCALLPAFVWAIDRTLRRTSTADPLILSLLTALLILCDPLYYTPTALIAGGVVCVLRGHQLRHTAFTIFISVGLGTALSAFYWLPALMEAGDTAWHTLNAGMTPAITSAALLIPVSSPDPAAGTPVAQYSLGLALIVTMALAVLARWLTQRPDAYFRAWMLTFLGTALALLYWQVPALTGAAAWFAALAGGTFITSFAHIRWQQRAMVVVFVGLMVTTIPLWLRSSDTLYTNDFSAQAQLDYELSGYGVAGVSSGEPVPSNLPLSAPPSAALLNAYTRDAVERLTLLSGTQDTVVLLRTQDARRIYAITSTTSITAHYALNPFTGWHADLDGSPVALATLPAQNGYGFTILPTRSSELVIYYRETNTQQSSWAISGAALLLVLLSWQVHRRHKPGTPTYPPLLQTIDIRLLCAAAVTIAILGNALSSERFVALPISQPGSSIANSTALPYRSNSALQLIAYDLETHHDQTLQAALHWRTLRVLDESYYVSLTLISTSGIELTQVINIPISHINSRVWQPNRYYTTHISMAIPNELPEGRYLLAFRIYPCAQRSSACDTSRALTFFDERGATLGTLVTLPRVITRP